MKILTLALLLASVAFAQENTDQITYVLKEQTIGSVTCWAGWIKQPADYPPKFALWIRTTDPRTEAFRVTVAIRSYDARYPLTKKQQTAIRDRSISYPSGEINQQPVMMLFNFKPGDIPSIYVEELEFQPNAAGEFIPVML